jgi:hypothetical protein
MTNFSSLFLIFAVQANPPFTRVNAFFEIKQPFFACAERADLETIISLMTRWPQGTSQREEALSYGRAHCLQIPRGIVGIERWEGDFSWVRTRALRRVCLWVPRELIRNTNLDDGVF